MARHAKNQSRAGDPEGASPEGTEMNDDSEPALPPPSRENVGTLSAVGSIAVRTSVSEPVFSFNRVSLPQQLDVFFIYISTAFCLKFCSFANTQ